MLIEENMDGSAKVFIVNAYIKEKYSSDYFMNKKYESLVRKIFDNVSETDYETLGNIISGVIVSMEEFNVSEEKALSSVKNNTVFEELFELIKNTNIAKSILNKVEIIHLVIDPMTGDYKQATIH